VRPGHLPVRYLTLSSTRLELSTNVATNFSGGRVAGTVSFDGAAPAGTINLGIGQPSADLLPVELLRAASDAYFREAQPNDLNYGDMQGDPRFLDSLARYLSAGYGVTTSAEKLFVTGGNSQALDLVSAVYANPGDTVFVEEPSYFLAFQIFRDHGLKIVGIPVDDDGLDVERLQLELVRHKPAFVYTIPTYHNPGGQSLSTERRKKLINLSREHDFLIVADEVYQLLSYFDDPPPALGTMIESDTVISLGSFSKLLAPGLRLGWIQTSPLQRQRLLANGFINSGGSINHYASHIVRFAIDLGLLDKHVGRLRTAYGARAEAMDAALQEHFSDVAQWSRPDGGYFFWLTFSTEIDTTPMKNLATSLETGFQPGAIFSAMGNLRNHLRLSFAHYGEQDIVEGVARLRPLFD
jgi:2-aminoadipate transaminase